MLIVHLAAALFAGLLAAGLALLAGQSLGAAFLHYVAGSTLGLLASAVAVLWLPRAPRQEARGTEEALLRPVPVRPGR
jgi:hypothetical protein